MFDTMQENMDVLCASPQDNTQRGLCTQSYLAFQKADHCVGEKTDDIIKCYKVCAWANHWHPRSRLNLIIYGFVYPLYVCVLGIALIRTVKNVQHVRSICMLEDTDWEE